MTDHKDGEGNEAVRDDRHFKAGEGEDDDSEDQLGDLDAPVGFGKLDMV